MVVCPDRGGSLTFNGSQHSIRINDQWRLCFQWTDAGPEGVADTAMRLARYFGGDAQSWLNLQTIHDLRIAERSSGRKIEREVVPAGRAAA